MPYWLSHHTWQKYRHDSPHLKSQSLCYAISIDDLYTPKMAVALRLSTLLLAVALGVTGQCYFAEAKTATGNCNFSTIFNFGDSNSDTGGLVAGLGLQLVLPYGQTFFKKPTGRYCDGRLVIDFLCEGFRLPFLSAYLESVGSSFSHGSNYACAASTATVSGLESPFSLPVQVNQFRRFKARVLDAISQGKQDVGSSLPPADAFEKALYTIDIGQNDIDEAFTSNFTFAQVTTVVIPHAIGNITSQLKNLYSEGGRNFIVHNTGPLGCLPRTLVNIRSDLSKLDENGCAEAYNEACQIFNTQLKAMCNELRSNLTGATIVYVDIYTIKYSLIANASQYGFEHPLAACCGYGGLPYNFNNNYRCSNNITVNGSTSTVGACEEPSKSVNWDGIHLTEAANFRLWSEIASGKFSVPRVSPHQACHQ